MSGKVLIDIYNLNGNGYRYDIDVGMKIEDLIKHVVNTHPVFAETKTFSPRLVDLKQTRLIHNGKTLESSKTLEEYIEFQYKSKNCNPYKMHIVIKGGPITPENIDEYENMLGPHLTKKTTSPISIKIPVVTNHVDCNSSDREGSRSFPSSNSFLESQINRLEKRQKADSLKQVSDSISDISNFITDLSENQQFSDNPQQFDKLEKILQILSCIDIKLNKLIELGSTSSQYNFINSPSNQYGISPSSQFAISPSSYQGNSLPKSFN